MEVFEDEVALGCLAAPPRSNGRKKEIFSEEVTAEAGKEGLVGRGFDQTATERVSDDDVAGSDSSKEARDAK